MAKRVYRESITEMLARLTIPDPATGCHIWLGPHNAKGYARLRPRGATKGMSSRVARVVYELKNGAIPDGLEVDHVCENRGCVNPDHLEAVTHQENIDRHWAKQILPEFCDKHPDTRRKPVGARGQLMCPVCKLEDLRKWRAERRAQAGLPPASYRGQRKFVCDTCGSPYEVLATFPDRGPRYGCRKCRQEYYRNRHARVKRSTT